jgi:hypothetical protein
MNKNFVVALFIASASAIKPGARQHSRYGLA